MVMLLVLDSGTLLGELKVRLREMLEAGSAAAEMHGGVAELLGPVLLKVDSATG